MSVYYALGLGLGTHNRHQQWLDSFYPTPLLSPSADLVAACLSVLPADASSQPLDKTQCEQLAGVLAEIDSPEAKRQAAIARQIASSGRPGVFVLLRDNSGPKTVPEAYLKLHLLSHRLVKPHQTALEGIFGVLPNIAWTSQGPIDLAELPERQWQARLAGQVLSVDSVDKFPKMTDYVVPTGVRIADTARVRLGAYIGEGTTIMHEGFVNFNAGTLGISMVEGRISSGVVVGEGSDLGGGCSTMGTLSGGGNIVISVGQKSLIGANAGIGIPLGDRCTVESGLYITAGTKLALLDDNNQLVKHLKARELAGMSDLLFRRNSLTGAVECKTNKSAVALNQALHINQ